MKNSPNKFCLDVSGLSDEDKRKFAKKLSKTCDSFNESKEDESQNDE